MNEQARVDRRKFFGAGLAGAGLLTAGGLAGWLGRKGPGPAERPALGPRFQYDVSAYQTTDPGLLMYDETGRIATGMHEPKCIEFADGGTLLLAGDAAVKMMDGAGTLRATITLDAKPSAVCSLPEGRVAVATKNRIAVFDAAGRRANESEVFDAKTHVTSLAVLGDTLFAADAGHREILRCDLACRVRSRFGRIGAGDGNPGFAIPSAYFDLTVGGDGLLWATNTGRHRVEAYTPEGHFELGWGETGMAIENFCGCCNPVHCTRLPDGRFVTSEKGLNRIKIYDARGTFAGVVAGVEHLVKDLELARRACANCQIGFGFDIACDPEGRVYALDPATRDIRIFTPRRKEATPA